MKLVSPVSGRALRFDGGHALTDGVERWPLVDGIAFLRVGREALAGEALGLLDAGERDRAVALLLADQDDWWRGEIAPAQARAELVAGRERLSLRAAMELLCWGPVGDYFAHRWGDPVFLAGLGLAEAHWTGPGTAFELACGIGHHLRVLAQLGVAVAGGDVVFAKLWVAKHWVVPGAALVCFDAAAPWPVRDRFDLVCCHDAFYFLEPKAEIAGRLRGVAAGPLLIGHVHNRDWPNYSAGSALSAAELGGMFPGAWLYDDAEVGRAALEGRAPVAAGAGELEAVEAFSVAENAPAARAVSGALVLPAAGTVLRRNPLYDGEGMLRFPSERYAAEYGPRSTYPARTDCPAQAVSGEAAAGWARRREMLDLPERW